MCQQHKRGKQPDACGETSRRKNIIERAYEKIPQVVRHFPPDRIAPVINVGSERSCTCQEPAHGSRKEAQKERQQQQMILGIVASVQHMQRYASDVLYI